MSTASDYLGTLSDVELLRWVDRKADPLAAELARRLERQLVISQAVSEVVAARYREPYRRLR